MPVARILPLAIRVGAVAATAYTAWTLRRAVTAKGYPGRVDQRAEDALDALDEGVSIHRSEVLGETEGDRQTNAAARFRRVVRLGGREVEIDASALARLRVRRI
ncbi:MAG: hypothetical protein QM656_08970 [Paracoccaceae bacterium]